MIQVSCCFLFLFCHPKEAGAFSGDFTTNLARQCSAFSRALKIEKLKAPLFRGLEGAGATNDWCIRFDFNGSLTCHKGNLGCACAHLFHGNALFGASLPNRTNAVYVCNIFRGVDTCKQ